MGWWVQNRKGESFPAEPPPKPEMMWGDGPADILADAVDDIRDQFRAGLHREPTLGELRAGLEFTLLGLPDTDTADALDAS